MREQRPNKLNNVQVKAIRERRAKGRNIAILADEFDVSTQAIRYHTKDIKPRKARYLAEYEDEILLLMGIHNNQSVVAKELGVTPGAINKALARMEWKAAA